jgi:hypothetical protein
MTAALYIFALVCGLVATIACLISTPRNWFAAVGFLGVVLLALIGVTRLF